MRVTFFDGGWRDGQKSEQRVVPKVYMRFRSDIDIVFTLKNTHEWCHKHGRYINTRTNGTIWCLSQTFLSPSSCFHFFFTLAALSTVHGKSRFQRELLWKKSKIFFFIMRREKLKISKLLSKKERNISFVRENYIKFSFWNLNISR